MTPETVMNELQAALNLGLIVATPLLGMALIIGVVIGLLQAATQVNEPSIAFIGKIFGLAAVLAIAGGWMLSRLVQFTISLYQRIPSMLG
jgi:flagellar biosynthetic protein FliQ